MLNRRAKGTSESFIHRPVNDRSFNRASLPSPRLRLSFQVVFGVAGGPFLAVGALKIPEAGAYLFSDEVGQAIEFKVSVSYSGVIIPEDRSYSDPIASVVITKLAKSISNRTWPT